MTRDEDDEVEPPLFTRYRPTDPETSAEAIEQIGPEGLRLLQLEVLRFFHRVRQATSFDLENHFHDHRSTYRTRISELRDKRFLRAARDENGKIIKVRQNGTNRTLWEVVPPRSEAPTKTTSNDLFGWVG